MILIVLLSEWRQTALKVFLNLQQLIIIVLFGVVAVLLLHHHHRVVFVCHLLVFLLSCLGWLEISDLIQVVIDLPFFYLGVLLLQRFSLCYLRFLKRLKGNEVSFWSMFGGGFLREAHFFLP